MSRCADGSEYAKGCGTSTFGSRCPCPACGRKMVDLRKLSSLGECAKDQRREYDNPDCDHTLDSCICNTHCMGKLASAFPITDRKHLAPSAECRQGLRVLPLASPRCG